MNRLTFFGLNLKALGAFAFLYPMIGHAQAPAALDPALQGLLEQAYQAVVNREWWLLAALLVTAITWAIHSPLAKRLPPAVKAFLDQPLVNYSTPLVLSAVGGLFTQLQTGHADWKAFTFTVVKIGLSSGGVFLALKNGAEQLAGGVPKPPTMVIALLVGAGLVLAPLPARAQALTVGPSLPAVAVTPGATHPVSLSPGAGISVGCGFFPSTLVGKPVHILGVNLDAFGVVVPTDGVVSGNLSVALQAVVFDLLSVGVGMKLASTDGFGALTGKLDHRSFFVLIGVADLLLRLMNFGHEAPPAVEQACDGDHPCAGPAPTGAAR